LKSAILIKVAGIRKKKQRPAFESKINLLFPNLSLANKHSKLLRGVLSRKWM